MKIDRIKHSCFRLVLSGKTLYFDPFGIRDTDKSHKADIVLISHKHFDHYKKSSIELVKKEDTVIICPVKCKKIVKYWTHRTNNRVHGMKPGDTITIKNIKIHAVFAYNLKKLYHRKKNEWLGYIINDGNVSVYHAGDTDFIPEMKNIKEINYALLPIGGKFTMNSEQAIQAIKIIQPKYIIPMHELNVDLDDFEIMLESSLDAPYKIKIIKLKPGESYSPDTCND
ncbi:MAG: MBL fold metallo-hydrolase [Promethearchaeota archaeon]